MTPIDLTLRLDKGSALTIEEADDNFAALQLACEELEAEKLSASDAVEITATKSIPDDADDYFVADSADGDILKKTPGGGIRTRLNNQVVGSSLGTTGTVDLDLAALTGTLQTITASGNITFTTSNRVAGRWLELRIGAGGSTRTLTWPAWVAYGAALPTSLASGKVLRVTISCTSTTDASIDATSALSV